MEGASYVFDINKKKLLIKTEWRREENFCAGVAGEKKRFPETR